jgi:hypothetical protein
LLAAGGMAGLTEAAVDAELGWDAGTTAGLGFTGTELVEVAAQRLGLLDGLRYSSFRASAASIAALLVDSQGLEARNRLMARLELFLFAARTPSFSTVRWTRELFVAGAEAHLRMAGARLPGLAALAIVALVEGLQLHSLIAAPLDRDDQLSLVRRVLRGFVQAPKGHAHH